MATIIKSDNANARKPYTVRYRDTFGTQREKSFVTRKEASTFANDAERGKRYGEDVNLTAARRRFTDAAEAWLDTVAVGDDDAKLPPRLPREHPAGLRAHERQGGRIQQGAS